MSNRIFLTAVPCLATKLEPFTFKSLISTLNRHAQERHH